MALEDEVATLLDRSHFAHRNALVLRRKRMRGALAQLMVARNLRRHASQLDPEHTAEAWRLEEKRFYKGIDNALQQFYRLKSL